MYNHFYGSRLGASLLAIFLLVGLGGASAGCDATSNGQVKSDEQPEREMGEKDGDEGGALKAEPEEISSKKQRITNPGVPEDARQALVAGNTQFAVDLYHAVSEAPKNVFFSPFSISEALAMTYAGARGNTATEMAETLHLNADPSQVHSAFNWLDLHLMSLSEARGDAQAEPLRLTVANSIWGQDGYSFKADFLDTLALNYGAGLRTVDFQGAPEASRETINDWVEAKTQGRIEDLLPEGTITPDTRLVLTNAIYFKAAWHLQFQKEQTESGEFHRADGSTVTADLMHQTQHLNYAQLDGFKALELPYAGGKASMVIFLPEDLGDFQKRLSPQTLTDTAAALGSEYVKVTLPKFEFSLQLPLTQTLKAMGMAEALSPGANFSGMTEKSELFISDVVHEAFVAVDEEGTEAAAATGVVASRTAMPPEPVEFRADKPFVFMIRDNETGTVLFLGRVVDPTA